MFRFQYLSYFWFFLLIPIVILGYIYFLAWRNAKLKKLGSTENVKRLIRGKIAGRMTTKVVLFSLAIISLVVGLANLQGGGHPEKAEQKGLNVMFTLDLSNSMLAQDLKPNRMTRAKEMIFRCLEQLKNDRTGLVVFAGNAYLQSPLTSDYGAMRMLLSSVTPSMMPTQGTNITDAIQLAARSFKKEDKQNKVIILISDGEDHSESAIKAAKELSKEGVIIYTVGIGSPEGTTLFDPNTGKDKTDMEGNVVLSKLNEDLLKSIAGAANGKYNLLNNSGQVANSLTKSLQQLESKNLGMVVFTDYKSYFQYFLAAALILMLLAWFLPDAKDSMILPESKSNLAALLVFAALFGGQMILPNSSYAQEQRNKKEPKPTLEFKKKINHGNELFNQRRYDEAQKEYVTALKENPQSFEGNFNMGDSYYGAGNNEESRKYFNQSLNVAKTKKDKAIAYHNMGNTFMKDRKWQEAVDFYKKSLIQNPNDQDTKYNLAYAQKMLQQQQQNNKNQDKNKDQNQQDKDNKNQDQQDKDQQNQDQQDQQNKDQNNQQDKKEQQSDSKDQQPEENQQGQKPKPMPSKLSKEQVENILNALSQEEKNLHKKKKEEQGVPVRPDKDW